MENLVNAVRLFFMEKREKYKESPYANVYGKRKYFFPTVRLYVISWIPRIISTLVFNYKISKPFGTRGSLHAEHSAMFMLTFINRVVFILVITILILGLINPDDNRGIRLNGLGKQLLKTVRRTFVTIAAIVLRVIMFFVDIVKLFFGSNFTEAVKRKANANTEN